MINFEKKPPRQRYIPSMIDSLVRVANDEKNNVKNTMVEALRDIGKHEPDFVLLSCANLFSDELALPHKVVLLNVITKVLEIQLENVHEENGLRLIELGVKEMTRKDKEENPKEKDKEKQEPPEWQAHASSVLVTLGKRFPRQIVDALLDVWPNGESPHYYVMKTLGDLAVANSLHVVPLLGEVFTRLLPIMPTCKIESTRTIIAASFSQFCEAIVNFEANSESRTVSRNTYSTQINTAFETFFTNWLPKGNSKKVRLATIQAIGSICNVLTTEQFEAQLQKLLTTFINLYKKEAEEEHLIVTQGFYNILSVATKTSKIAIEPLLPKILSELFPFICKPIDLSVSTSLKNNNELLRCLEIIGIAFTDNLLTFVMQKLENKTNTIRNGGVIIVKHIITRIQPYLQEKKRNNPIRIAKYC